MIALIYLIAGVIITKAGILALKTAKLECPEFLSLNDVLMKWKFLKISCILIPTRALSSNK